MEIFTKTAIMMFGVSATVNITGKRSYIHASRKSDNYKSDEMDKQFLIDLLYQEFGIAAIRPEPIMTLSGKPRYADVKSTNTNPVLFFELDGEYHGYGDEITMSRGTWERNYDYEQLGHKLLVINKADTDGYNKKKVLERLKALFNSFGFYPSKGL